MKNCPPQHFVDSGILISTTISDLHMTINFILYGSSLNANAEVPVILSKQLSFLLSTSSRELLLEHISPEFFFFQLI